MAVVSSRRERTKAIVKEDATYIKTTAHFRMLEGIHLWIPNEKPKVDARKTYKTVLAT